MALTPSEEASLILRSALAPISHERLDLAVSPRHLSQAVAESLGQAGTEADATGRFGVQAQEMFTSGQAALAALDARLREHFVVAFDATTDRLAAERQDLGAAVEKGQGLLGGLQTGSLEDQPALSGADGAMVEQRDREPKVELEVAI